MKNFIRFTLAAFIYGVAEACAGIVFIIPPKIVSLAIFLAPILGLMWGPVAAIGVCIGGLAVSPIFHDFVSNPNSDISAWLPVFGTAAGLFLASYLPYAFWHKWKMPPRSFNLSTATMQKFLAILFVTFTTTSLVRTITASEQELQAATGLFGFVRNNAVMSYMATCFLNDFVIAVFLDLFLLFILISRNYPFHATPTDFEALKEKVSFEERLVLVVASTFYLTLPGIVAFLDLYQIYGMDNLDTWVNFIGRCMSLMDLYIILIICLLFRYRRSIMLQIVFLVAVIVLMSTAVLGWGSSLAMSTMVKHNMDETLKNMSIICRERLNRTFFCTRQAVNGMERQALKSVESFDKIATDAAYRENYLNAMQQEFDSIAMDTDGCLAYYLRLNPEFAGGRSGFSMVRADSRWEGALAPFTKRAPARRH